MGLGMFTNQHSPIAIDFGASSVKVLQIGAGERPSLLAAGALDIPDEMRNDVDSYFAYLHEWLPPTFQVAKFRGRRAVISLPASQTYIQHMQLPDVEGGNRDEMIKSQLQAQMGCPPHGVVVRPVNVCSMNRNGQALKEVICFAIARDTVMRYIELLKKFKIEVVGVHTDTMSTIRAFDHIHRRASDGEITSMYIDLGWGGTRVAITHGKELVFARHIPIGGKQFDHYIATNMKVQLPIARTHRLSMRSAKSGGATESQINATGTAMAVATEATATAVAERRTGNVPRELQYHVDPNASASPAVNANIDLTELLDTITDEMSMCVRYHQGLFPQRSISRAIFVGGESRQAWLCQHIVKSLRVPAQLGDPMARFDHSQASSLCNVQLTPPQPGWAVACGLCTSPTDV